MLDTSTGRNETAHDGVVRRGTRRHERHRVVGDRGVVVERRGEVVARRASGHEPGKWQRAAPWIKAGTRMGDAEKVVTAMGW